VQLIGCVMDFGRYLDKIQQATERLRIRGAPDLASGAQPGG
jgi:hypothetical protein